MVGIMNSSFSGNMLFFALIGFTTFSQWWMGQLAWVVSLLYNLFLGYQKEDSILQRSKTGHEWVNLWWRGSRGGGLQWKWMPRSRVIYFMLARTGLGKFWNFVNWTVNWWYATGIYLEYIMTETYTGRQENIPISFYSSVVLGN